MSPSPSYPLCAQFATLQSILNGWRQRPASGRYLVSPAKKCRAPRLCVERLEDRTLLDGVSFAPPLNSPTGTEPLSVAVGDFNNDGKLDAVTANSGSNNISVFLGNSDGTFQAPKLFAVGSTPWFVATGDFDHDGKLDLAVANFGDNTVSVLLGNGDGTFHTSQTIAVGQFPVAIGVGDFARNGKLDLAVVNEGDDTISILLANGDGTFQTGQTFNVVFGSGQSSIAVADFNRDGKLDLAVTNDGLDTVTIYLGNGDGTFQLQNAPSFPTGPEPVGVAVGDFNGDNIPDLVVANNNRFSPGPGSISILLGNGDSTFQPHQDFPAGTFPNAGIAVADFNGDHKPDVVVSNGGSQNVSVFLGNGDGSLQAAQNFAVGNTPQSVAVGDFNNDGRPDIVTANEFDNTVSVLLNQSTVSTTPTVTPPANQNATEGTGQSFSLGRFSDSSSGPWTAAINWGDGTPNTSINPTSPGTLGSQPHLFAEEGTFTVTITVKDTGDGLSGLGTFQVTVADPNVIGMPANLSPTAGAPFSGAVATFTDPGGAEANGGTHYSASIAWGDNTPATTGTITLLNGVFTVSGTHTYAAANSYSVTITINHEGNASPLQEMVTVTSLGQIVPAGLSRPISFWAGLQGQELVRRFGPTAGGQTLGQWLATAFPNLYGGGNGAPNLSPFSNAQISSYYQSLFLVSKGTGLDAEVLATAMEVFTTTLSLGGTAGQAYGFTVNSNGLGAYSWNIGASGQAFGVTNNTVLDVYQILLAANNTAAGGEPWGSNTLFRNEAFAVFHGVNGG